MRLIYVLLSPTFGMHQYTADLVNRMIDGRWQIVDGKWQMADRRSPISYQQSAISYPDVVLVTTTTLPRDRYSPAVRIETPLTSHGTGFAREGLNPASYRRVWAAINYQLSVTGHEPSAVVHFTGVHAWNVPLVWALRRRGAPVIHTLHDLHPHGGVRFGGLISLWNRLIIGSGAHILVHGRHFREELITGGVPTYRVTYAPLLHGFWGYQGLQRGGRAEGRESGGDTQHATRNTQYATLSMHSPIEHRELRMVNSPLVLFFGRVEAYKGVDVLLAAWESLQEDHTDARLVIAGPVAPGVALPTLPPGVELRDRLIDDTEAIELFRSASLLVLPYRDATQSALIGAAYALELPVIVTETGALPEYVVAGETGWVVPPNDAAALADALRRALADSTRLRSAGQAGHAWYDERRREEEAAITVMYQEVSGKPP